MRPGNYSVHFLEQLQTMPVMQGNTSTPRSAANLRWLARQIEISQHFILPDEGRLIEVNEMPDFMPDIMRPPYHRTVVEYTAAKELAPDRNDQVVSSKRVILAIDVQSGDDLPPKPLALTTVHEGPGVLLIPISYYDELKFWGPPAMGLFVRYGQEVVRTSGEVYISDHQLRMMGQSREKIVRTGVLDVMAVGLAVDQIMQVNTPHQLREIVDQLMADAQSEMFAYQQMCLALSCKNVGTEKIDAEHRLNRARIRRGKRSLFDYHILTVPGADTNETGENTGRTVRSHLRRGHIRRLSGQRLTWVNATIVKGGSAGFVHKTYEVAA